MENTISLAPDMDIEEEFAPPEGFHICDKSSAEWYLRKIAAIESEIALIQAQAGAALARLASSRSGLERLFASEMEMYVREAIQGSGKKSVIFLHGTASLRTVPRSVRVADEEAAIAYCQRHHIDLIKTRLKLDNREYVELMKETGEALPGLEVSPERETFNLKFTR